MAVIITNMDMPKDCYGCNIQNCEYFADRLSCDGRPSSCPLKSADDYKPILDKLRSDIEDWQTDIHDNEYDADTHDFVFERIYEIIDEYKAESEG